MRARVHLRGRRVEGHRGDGRLRHCHGDALDDPILILGAGPQGDDLVGTRGLGRDAPAPGCGHPVAPGQEDDSRVPPALPVGADVEGFQLPTLTDLNGGTGRFDLKLLRRGGKNGEYETRDGIDPRRQNGTMRHGRVEKR